MNKILKVPVNQLGYQFIDPAYLPKGKDEYYLRKEQHTSAGPFRALAAGEIKQLELNGNVADDWSQVLVHDNFDPSLIQQCKFYGLVRIGEQQPYYLQFHDVRLPVGLYNSTIISCDIGNNVVVNNVNYLSHYIIGNEVILVNINEMEVTDHAKFGNGIIKEGEKEAVRIWMELCNENAGRSVLLFDGMQAGDAWLWTRFRADETLMQKLKEFTEKRFSNKRGYYGMVGDRCVIKNTRIIKDCLIGTDAYIKGANKLKNLTINSSGESPTQIGEGCELVNGIIGYGCKAFYGVKAVRFILASHSQLKYGARLINSFLGDNSTISCCEVLNSLIFPAHEQHHNNSFLCASLLSGQSNMAAGATIGSNHNSRSADGELIAGRGFWPGLCVSLKHNSRFASFTIIAKGDFPAELNIPIPFSLVSNDVSRDQLVIMPGYWFMYNMYALARNEGKYASRDKRSLKNQYLEYDYLAPDSVNELFDALQYLQLCVGKSIKKNSRVTEEAARKAGRRLLDQQKSLGKKEILASGIENSKRKVKLVKVAESYAIFKELIVYYGITQLLYLMEKQEADSLKSFFKKNKITARTAWVNIGGQLMPQPALQELIHQIHAGEINSWDAVHEYYHMHSAQYADQKALHAITSLLELEELKPAEFTLAVFKKLLRQTLQTREWMVAQIQESRAKDYSNPFRQMVYDSIEEMEKVVGSLKDNSFINQQIQELESFREKIKEWTKRVKA
ncbi:MAG: DUF4954 family protein [Chitinophagaceae bacterium]|nr:DUF4954 family protein [Chitinophagaceae bacterium]